MPLAMSVHTTTYNLRCTFKFSRPKCLEKNTNRINSVSSQCQRKCKITKYNHVMYKTNKIVKLYCSSQDSNRLPWDPTTKIGIRKNTNPFTVEATHATCYVSSHNNL